MSASTLPVSAVPSPPVAPAPPVPHQLDRRAVVVGASTSATADAAAHAPRPLMRGWLHAAGTPVAAAVGAALVAGADAAAVWSTAVCAAVSVIVLATSAVYHLGRWSEPALVAMKRLDHGNIPLMVAAGLTPVVALGMPPMPGRVVLVAVWVAAALAVGFRWLWPHCPRRLHTGVSLALGWAVVPALPTLGQHSGTTVLALVLGSGVLFTAGAVVFVTRRPDPWPLTFGYHEVFHALTLLAWPLLWAAVALLGTGPSQVTLVGQG